MKILGIHDGHTATASLFEDGKVLAAASEERFLRNKCWAGFPKKAITWMLEYTDTTPTDIDMVVFPTTTIPLKQGQLDLKEAATPFRRMVSFSTSVLPSFVAGSNSLVGLYQKVRARSFESQKKELASLGIRAPIKTIDHHTSHAASALFSGIDHGLVFTLDGSGDGYSGSVWTYEEGHLTEKKRISAYHSLGEIYTRVTQYLGMKPLEHEYKVMGLAPYAPKKIGEPAYEVFKEMFTVDGLNIKNTSGAWGLEFYKMLKNKLNGMRFDAIAYGLQKRFEEVVIKWVRNWMKEVGTKNIMLGGGSFMNVKLNGKLSAMSDEFFVFPSCGDESLPITASGLTYFQETGKIPEKLGPIYFGPQHEFDGTTNHKGLSVEKISNPDKRAAELVANNKIVARSSGRMEWGARALGNRSILANGASMNVVWKINRAIKKRDFWMPFAPSIQDSWIEKYFDTKRMSPYMILAFDSTDLAKEHIIAALQQGDMSGRPQTVNSKWNEGYHKTLKWYEKLTGRGGFLNTSFNLHGDPIVNTPDDAIYTFVNSELDYLFIDDYMISRK